MIKKTFQSVAVGLIENLEKLFLMALMRLRLELLVDDLAFRFKTSNTRVSQIWITWIKLLSEEL